MRLLFDQNLSHRLCDELAQESSLSARVRQLGMERADDETIWQFAKENGFTIVSKDSDFYQQSFLYGPPPKIVWLRVGNCSTEHAADLLRRHVSDLAAFDTDPDAAILTLS